MTDTPKRRGRPPKARDVPMVTMAPTPLDSYRVKAGRLQRAWQYPNGRGWHDVPVVPESAPDWEDSP
jgi:hypothetical protein